MVIDPGVVGRALATIGSSPANREYFFAKLRSPEWLGPLRLAGRFKAPVRALRDKGGVTFVPWPESTYLARVAAQAPDLVCDIILETEPTDNERVHQDFAEAAAKMTPSTAAAVARFEAAWIGKQPFLYTLYPEKIGELISYLAKQGQQDAALALARELLAVVAPPSLGEEEEDDERPLRMPPDPRGKCRQWEYQRVLSMHIPDLVEAAPEPASRLLADLLEMALRIRSRGQYKQTEDYSWIWRPEIKVRNFDNLAEALVSATRDTAMSLSTSAEGTAKIVDLLRSRQWRVFRRIASYVLQTSSTSPIQKVEEMLADPTEYQDFPGRSPEFDKLLAEHFIELTEQGKGRVLSFIEAGPDLTIFRKRRESEGKPASDTEVAEVADYWRLRWLHQVGEALPQEWHERYEALGARFGKPSAGEPPGRIHSHVGPNSPKSAEELAGMSTAELIDFLQTWKSTGEWNAPSAEGVGRTLSAVLEAEPQKLAQNASLLRGLEPTYVRSSIDGFTAAIKRGRSLDWAQVIHLCEWVIQQGNEIKEPKESITDADPDWNWTRKSVGWFLIEALKVEGSAALPLSWRELLWTLLEALAEDPIPFEETMYGKGMFVGSMSLNVTRGVALDGMLHYARWLHEQGGLPADSRTLDSIPELKRALEEHLRNDNSVVAREVLGRGFPTLFWLDKRWASSAADLIFGDKRESLGEVAWANYLMSCPAYDDLLPILVGYYRGSID